jgi:hypothetical protein
MRPVRFFSIVVLFCLLVVEVNAQVTSTAFSIGIDAKVFAPITIVNTGSTPLNFGTISRPSISGEVTITEEGNRTSSGGVSLMISSDYSAAPFAVTGDKNATISITLPSDDLVRLEREGGSETMAVDFFKNSPCTSLDNEGKATFIVGATLKVSANQAPGDYKGDFEVTVAYN